MKQQNLATAGFELATKRTRKREFLDEMNLVVPWSELVALIQPHAPAGKTGRPPFAVETMLRIHFMQQWFGLSDPAMEEALRDKTDARDAQAIWAAAQQLHIKPVPVKREQQQACLALHRLRAQLMKMRIMQTNGLRGLLYEFGIVLPEGHRLLLQRIQGELASAQEQGRLPKVLVESVQDQLRRID